MCIEFELLNDGPWKLLAAAICNDSKGLSPAGSANDQSSCVIKVLQFEDSHTAKTHTAKRCGVSALT